MPFLSAFGAAMYAVDCEAAADVNTVDGILIGFSSYVSKLVKNVSLMLCFCVCVNLRVRARAIDSSVRSPHPPMPRRLSPSTLLSGHVSKSSTPVQLVASLLTLSHLLIIRGGSAVAVAVLPLGPSISRLSISTKTARQDWREVREILGFFRHKKRGAATLP